MPHACYGNSELILLHEFVKIFSYYIKLVYPLFVLAYNLNEIKFIIYQ